MMLVSRSLPILLLILPSCAAESNQPASSSPVPVDLATVTVEDFTPEVQLLGRIEAHETVPVIVPDGGIIAYSDRFPTGLKTGVRVERGELLASILNESARLDLSEARLLDEAAQQRLDRLQKGYDAGITTSSEISDAKIEAEIARNRLASAERKSSRLWIRAPRAGTLVVETRWAAGTEVPSQQILASVAAGGTPRIVARASAGQRRLLTPGLPVNVIDPSTGLALSGSAIEEIDSVVDRAGTATVIISVPAAGSGLVPGEGVVARVLLPTRRTITLPERAIVHSSDGSAVFVVENERARRTPVTLGAQSSGSVEVLSGLDGGEQVVVTGAAFLSDGLAVTDATETGGQR